MVDLPIYLIYAVYTTVLGIVAIVLVPKSCFKRLAFYSIFFGGVYDIFWIVLIDLIGAGGYKNYGPFGFLKIPFFPPIAWTIFFIMYLYILPEETPWNYLLAIIGAMYSTLFSNVLQNLGIFKWNYGRVIFPFFLYLVWLTSVTFLYGRYVLKKK